jgi:hypothetical protein
VGADWAYKIAKEYGLSTDWILTGKGPKRQGEQTEKYDQYIEMLEQWLRECSEIDLRKRAFFEIKLETTFPEFKEWLDKRNNTEC